MCSAQALEVEGLSRSYDGGSSFAVKDVTFKVGEGQVVALLGANGAGKTSTVRMCATMLRPTAGQIRIGGIDAVFSPRQARERMAVVLGGERGFYSRASLRDNLAFFADVYSIPKREIESRLQSAIAEVELVGSIDAPVSSLSRGMVQRLHLARALMLRPTLLLLDEPTSGLDPEIAASFRELISTLANGGCGVLLTTHYLFEAEALADRFIVLQAGRTAFEGSIAELGRRTGTAYVATFSCPGLSHNLEAALASSGAREVRRELVNGLVRAIFGWNSVVSPQAVEQAFDSAGEERPPDLTLRPATLEEKYLVLASEKPA